jgi:hypothetical protein
MQTLPQRRLPYDAFLGVSTARVSRKLASLQDFLRMRAGCVDGSAEPLSPMEMMHIVDTGGEERVALQVQHLTVALGGDAHVADQHVRKTPSGRFPHSASFRQGLSCIFLTRRASPV